MEEVFRYIDATNLYFMYCIEINFNLTEDYTDIAVKTSQYNAKALVNKGKRPLYKERIQNRQRNIFRSHWHPGEFYSRNLQP